MGATTFEMVGRGKTPRAAFDAVKSQKEKSMKKPNTVFFEIGSRFNKLVVLAEIPKRSQGSRMRRMFLVRCDCGNETIAGFNSLRYGRKKSCGCLSLSRGGLTKHPLFRVWRRMCERCFSPKHKAWKSYGARGITICDEWLDAGAFHAWAIKTGWAPGLELHRCNNDKGYNPSNCKWLNKNDHRKAHLSAPREKMVYIALSLPG